MSEILIALDADELARLILGLKMTLSHSHEELRLRERLAHKLAQARLEALDMERTCLCSACAPEAPMLMR